MARQINYSTRRSGGARNRRARTNYKPSRLLQCFGVSESPKNPVDAGRTTCHKCGKNVAVRHDVLVHHHAAN